MGISSTAIDIFVDRTEFCTILFSEKEIMVSEERILQLAYRAGMRSDHLGLPIVDSNAMIIQLVRLIEKEIEETNENPKV